MKLTIFPQKLFSHHQLIENYTIKKTLGRGAFGKVCSVTDKSTNKSYAMKIISLGDKLPNEIVQLSQEYAINQAISHENILKIYNQFADDENYYLIMELCDKSLLEQIRQWHTNKEWQQKNLKTIVKTCNQIISAVRCIHDKNIVHRDIQPANILIIKSNNGIIIKICDFGTAKVLLKNSMTTNTGTFNYMAPERLDEHSLSPLASDIWATGCVFFEICTSQLTFPGEMPFKNIVTGVFNSETIINLELRNFIQNMLKIDYKKRPTAVEVLAKIEAITFDDKNDEPQQSISDQVTTSSNQFSTKLVTQSTKTKQQALVGQKDSFGKMYDYEGEVSNGKPHGFGTAIYKTGLLLNYVGNYENGIPNGSGSMKFKDGSRYEGLFVNGNRNGHGVLYQFTGEKYAGEWKDNKNMVMVKYISQRVRLFSRESTQMATQLESIKAQRRMVARTRRTLASEGMVKIT